MTNDPWWDGFLLGFLLGAGWMTVGAFVAYNEAMKRK